MDSAGKLKLMKKEDEKWVAALLLAVFVAVLGLASPDTRLAAQGLLVALFSGGIGAAIAKPRGEAAKGFLLGFFLLALGWVLVVLLVGPRCPHCGGIVNAGVSACRNCGRDLPVAEASAQSVAELPSPPPEPVTEPLPDLESEPPKRVHRLWLTGGAIGALFVLAYFVVWPGGRRTPVVADGCTVPAVNRDLSAFNAHVSRWNESLGLARQTPRISLSNRIADLQQMHRGLPKVSTVACTWPMISKEYDAEQKELDGLTAFLDSSVGDVLALGPFQEAATLRADVARMNHDLRKRLWPEQVDREDRERAAAEADARRRESEASAAQAARQAEERRQEELAASQAEAARAAKEQQSRDLRAHPFNDKKDELGSWLEKNRRTLPVLAKSLESVQRALTTGGDPAAQAAACKELRSSYETYVSEMKVLPPDPPGRWAKGMDEGIRSASLRCDQGKFQDAYLILRVAQQNLVELGRF